MLTKLKQSYAKFLLQAHCLSPFNWTTSECSLNRLLTQSKSDSLELICLSSAWDTVTRTGDLWLKVHAQPSWAGHYKELLKKFWIRNQTDGHIPGVQARIKISFSILKAMKSLQNRTFCGLQEVYSWACLKSSKKALRLIDKIYFWLGLHVIYHT